LIEAMAQVVKVMPDVLLMIVGEPLEDYSKYRKLIVTYGLEKSIFEELRYIDNNEIAQFFFAADVVALPYRSITQSGVLLTAYAFGKPVIATRVGGFLEAIDNEQSGLLVPPESPNDFACSLLRLLNDETLCARFSAQGIKLSQTHFSWDMIAEKTIKVYGDTLN